MSSIHLFDPQKSIRFVRGGELVEETTNTKQAELDGEEIRKFYEDLIGQPNTSTAGVKVKIEEVKKETVRSKPIVKKLKVELTERDERLFFKAAETDDVDTLFEYLQAGIDANLKDSFGWNALMCAAASGSFQTIQVLLQNGGDFDYSVNGMNAEQLARKNKHTGVARFISEYRCAKTDQDIVEVHDLIEEQFCDVCNRSHFDSKHESSIVHLVRLNERPAEGYAYGIEMSNPGYRLLKLKQWNEGEGLGSGNNKGRRYPIRTTLKRDKKGLGLERLKAKVTHFESLDPNATQSVKRPRRTFIRQLDKEIAKKKQKEMMLRRSLM